MGIRRIFLPWSTLKIWPLSRAGGGPLTDEGGLRFLLVPPDVEFRTVSGNPRGGSLITFSHREFPDGESHEEIWDFGGEGVHWEEWRNW